MTLYHCAVIVPPSSQPPSTHFLHYTKTMQIFSRIPSACRFYSVVSLLRLSLSSVFYGNFRDNLWLRQQYFFHSSYRANTLTEVICSLPAGQCTAPLRCLISVRQCLNTHGFLVTAPRPSYIRRFLALDGFPRGDALECFCNGHWRQSGRELFALLLSYRYRCRQWRWC